MTNIRERTTVLSESVGGKNIKVLAAVAGSETLVHTVPDGETHEITLYAVNSSTGLNEINGLWGGTDPVLDILDFTLPGESTRPALIREAVLVGPATVKLRAKLATAFVFGKVVTFLDVTP